MNSLLKYRTSALIVKNGIGIMYRKESNNIMDTGTIQLRLASKKQG